MTDTTFDRPISGEERELLMKLAAHVLAGQAPAPCTDDEAAAVLARLNAMGQLDIEENAQDVYLRASGKLLVECRRDWLAFHARFPGNDPLRDEVRH